MGMIRLLYLRWHRRVLLRALDNCRQAMADAAESERIFERDLSAVDAAIAAAELDRRYGALK